VEPWTIALDELTLELRPTDTGQIGLFPEQAESWAWLRDAVRWRASSVPDHVPNVLNLFAHTGVASLVAAAAGATVAHVDSSRPSVAWARRNAELSDLADRPIRWLVDDAAAFVAREARRGRRYDGIVLDPPSFGHGRGRRWRLADELPDLLAACREIAADDAFVLLTAHTTGMDGTDLAAMMRAALPSPSARLDGSALELLATSGARLDLGWSVRLTT
jgi:23S rRNA (cytosine1962-C5)-methyltransferase